MTENHGGARDGHPCARWPLRPLPSHPGISSHERPPPAALGPVCEAPP
jgi:hypothetical protein